MSWSRADAELAAHFDRCAANGDMDEFEPAELEAVERLLDEWGVAPGERVLEPGCGSGRLTALLAGRVGPEGLVLGLDLSAAMLRRARRRGLGPQVRFECASAGAVPAPDRFFHRVICFNVFPHFTEPKRVLAELERVMAPGASLWIAHLASREELNAFHAGLDGPVRGHRLPPPEELERLLVAAGLRVRHLENGDGRFSAHALRAPQRCPGEVNDLLRRSGSGALRRPCRRIPKGGADEPEREAEPG